MTTLFYYYIGNALERQWGTTRFTVFYGLGILLNIIMGFVMGSTSMYYINMSMFFSFATLYPEMQVLLFRDPAPEGEVAGLAGRSPVCL